MYFDCGAQFGCRKPCTQGNLLHHIKQDVGLHTKNLATATAALELESKSIVGTLTDLQMKSFQTREKHVQALEAVQLSTSRAVASMAKRVHEAESRVCYLPPQHSLYLAPSCLRLYNGGTVITHGSPGWK